MQQNKTQKKNLKIYSHNVLELNKISNSVSPTIAALNLDIPQVNKLVTDGAEAK